MRLEAKTLSTTRWGYVARLVLHRLLRKSVNNAVLGGSVTRLPASFLNIVLLLVPYLLEAVICLVCRFHHRPLLKFD